MVCAPSRRVSGCPSRPSYSTRSWLMSRLCTSFICIFSSRLRRISPANCKAHKSTSNDPTTEEPYLAHRGARACSEHLEQACSAHATAHAHRHHHVLDATALALNE